MRDGRLVFEASGGQLLGFALLQALLVVGTAGLWILVLPRALKRWKLHHTRIDGMPVRYQGGVGAAVVFGVVKPLLVAATVGLVTPWLVVRARRYEREHTRLADGRRLTFDGTARQALVLLLLTAVLLPLSCGLAFPWLYALWKKWEWQHSRLSRDPVVRDLRGAEAREAADDGGWRDFVFEGRGGTLVGPFLWNAALVGLTLGLYAPWASVNLFRWEAEHSLATS